MVTVANTNNDAELKIPPTGLGAGETITISLTVSNFFGSTDTASVTVGKANAKLPTVFIESGSELSMKRDESRKIVAKAKYEQCGDALEEVVLEGEWVSSDGLDLAAFATLDPRVLRIPEDTLTVGDDYEFVFNVWVAGSAELASAASIAVTVESSPLKIVMSPVPTLVGVDTGITFTVAELSTDPDGTAADTWDYSWSCALSSDAPCPDSVNAIFAAADTHTVESAAGSLVTNADDDENYMITVSVSSGGR